MTNRSFLYFNRSPLRHYEYKQTVIFHINLCLSNMYWVHFYIFIMSSTEPLAKLQISQDYIC